MLLLLNIPYEGWNTVKHYSLSISLAVKNIGGIIYKMYLFRQIILFPICHLICSTRPIV